MTRTFANLALLTGLAASALPTPARADDKATCLDAASKGQKLRDGHSLVEAREQLRICAAATCPPAISSDCTGWLADVENALPTVVVSVKNGAGNDLFDVKVAVDGKPLLDKLDGRAVPMDAGPHAFHFTGSDGTVLDRQILVREGEKNQELNVVLGAAATTPATPSPAASPATLPSTPPTQEPSSSGSTWKTVGWITGAAGIVGLGVGATFGFIALHDKNDAGCNANNVCANGTTGAIRSSALVSDVGWIAGGVLLATGAALVLFAPDGSPSAPTAVRVAPIVASGGGGAVVGAAW